MSKLDVREYADAQEPTAGERLDKVEFAASALDASTQVLKEILTYPPTRGQLEVTPMQFTRDDVTVIARLSGDITAKLFLGMKYGTARQIAREMLQQEMDDLGTLGRSALAELGNMISESTIALLEPRGALCYGAWSSVLLGSDERLTAFSVPSLVVPLRLLVGQINLNVALEAYAPYTWAAPEARRAGVSGLQDKSVLRLAA